MEPTTFFNDNDLLDNEIGLATISLLRTGFCPEGAQALPYQARLATIIKDLNAGLLAPVRRLPTEILQLIFLAFVEKEDSYDWARILRAKIMPVCFTWRETAKGYPYIWTYVDISRPPLPMTRWWTQLDPNQVERQIARTGQLPLGIQYCCNSQMELDPILDQCGPRLRSFAFGGTCHELVDQRQFDLPILTSVAIAISGQISKLTLSIIAGAPNLQHLSLVQSRTHLAAFAFEPWVQSMSLDFPRFPRLTHLSISLVTALTSCDLWRVIESCHDTLTTLIVDASIIPSSAASTPMLTLTSLHTIDLTSNVIVIGTFISAPNIVSVSLRDISDAVAPPCIFGLIRRLASGMATKSLRCVTLERVSSWGACLADVVCTQAMATVEHLEILDRPTALLPPRRYVPFMRAMLYTPGKQPLFPSLRYLSLLCGGHHIEDGLQDAMDDFQESRRAEIVGQVAHLEVFATNVERDRTFHMYDSEDEDEDDAAEVEISLLTSH
ncbi:uncharacterized protein SCHCODRAFT_0107504 [Schizophyllum commune H4-8]|uniref:uncharacterized protein n=1 Tax=Schizophyllum commune (strain H4-8 / FGSC 9210) TaxID=578458 RepID=UPI00215EAFC5